MLSRASRPESLTVNDIIGWSSCRLNATNMQSLTTHRKQYQTTDRNEAHKLLGKKTQLSSTSS